jgi:hypothetical protein
MSISTLEQARAVGVSVGEDAIAVELSDARLVSAPLAWFPRLLHGTPAERADWRLIGDGEGLHWPQLDEDIAVEGLLAGRPSNESGQSLKAWFAGRAGA